MKQKKYLISLEEKIRNGSKIKKETLTDQEWKQLWIVENPGKYKIEEIFGQKYDTVYKYMNKKIGKINSYLDEEFIFDLLLKIDLHMFDTNLLTKIFLSMLETKLANKSQ